jgi:DNA polymerase-2
VLYGDTDSVFVALDPDAAAGAAQARAAALRDAVQARIADRVRREFRVEPRLELELEHVFRRFFQPRVRHGSQGRKKSYAGLVDGQVQVVGLEAVRRDAPAVARRLQLGMLERLFADQPVAPFAREVAERVLAGELDAELVIRKGVRKGALDRYTATTPPHVKAARKAAEAGEDVDRVVRYVMTETGPEPLAADGSLPPHVDRRHYVERVLRPIADAILEELGTSFDAVLGAGRQLTLL